MSSKLDSKICSSCPFYRSTSNVFAVKSMKDGIIHKNDVKGIISFLGGDINLIDSNACHEKHAGLPIEESINHNELKDCVGFKAFKKAYLLNSKNHDVDLDINKTLT